VEGPKPVAELFETLWHGNSVLHKLVIERLRKLEECEYRGDFLKVGALQLLPVGLVKRWI
jgi:hypothetical protein